MPTCSADGCSNKSGVAQGKSFFKIPDPKENSELCKRWLGFKSCLHELESYGFRLKSIATDRNAQITKWKDMGQLVNPLHTGSLEVFHSLINSYASKRNHFELNVMDARIKLAILDHNCNISRKQATVQRPRVGSGKKEKKQWKYISSKLSKEWVTKEIKEKKSYSFVTKLLVCLLYTSPSPRDLSTSRMPSSA